MVRKVNKRYKGLVLAALMGISLFTGGCGKSDGDGTDTVGEETTSEVSSEEATSEFDESSVVNTMTKKYKRGRADGNTYKNEFFSIGCVLDDQWKIYSDAEIDEINQFQEGAATDENVAAVLEQSYLLDMAAARYDGNANISIIVQNKGNVRITEDEFTKSGLGTATSVMEQSGYTDTDAEIGKVNFCGRERTVINIKAKTQDKDVYEKQLSMINGSYVIVITFRAFDEKDLDAAVKAFSILK